MSDMTQLAEGQLIANQFRITRKLGEGGMGAVFLAEQVGIEREVVVKVLRAKSTETSTIALERFRREAKAVAQLNHPNIVQVYVFGEAAPGQLYLAMEYVEGRDLARELKLGPLPQPRALRIMDQVCAGLMEAHVSGIVHRDLKPENIMLTDRHGNPDYVKVLDFGIAKRPLAEGEATLTQAGTLFGTPRYMAPEQARGIPADARSDIYALGLVLYEMLTGRHPFSATSAVEYLVKHMNEPVVPPREAAAGLEIQPRVEQIVLRCLEKEPSARYQRVADLQRDVRLAMRDFSEAARGYPSQRIEADGGEDLAVAEEAPSATRSGARRWAWAGVALVVAGGGTGLGVALGGHETPPKAAAAGRSPGTSAVVPGAAGPGDVGDAAADSAGAPARAAPTTRVAEGAPVDGFPMPRDLHLMMETPQASEYATPLTARELIGFFEAKLGGKFTFERTPKGLDIADPASPFEHVWIIPDTDRRLLHLERNRAFVRSGPEPHPSAADAFGFEVPGDLTLELRSESNFAARSRRPLGEVCKALMAKYQGVRGVRYYEELAAKKPTCWLTNETAPNGTWTAAEIENDAKEPGIVSISVNPKHSE